MQLMRLPNLNALRMFDAAARQLNFRRAAEELNLTQGAVAQQVRRLEAELGQLLFHRHARGLELTEVGRAFHQPIRKAFDLIGLATEALAPTSAIVTISVTPSFAAKWLVPRLSLLATALPELNLRTIASEKPADFKADSVDIAVRQGKKPSLPGMEARLLAPLNLVAVCDGSQAAVLPKEPNLAQIASFPLIQDAHSLWERVLPAAGMVGHRRMLQFNQTALAIDAARAGHGIVLAPLILVDDEIAAGSLRIVWETTMSDDEGYWLLYRQGEEAGSKDTKLRDSVIAWLLSEIAGPDRNA